MAGGQSASFEQGSPGVSGTVALSGSAITSGIGLLNVGSDTIQAATGQAMSSAIGSTGSARLILLKSRKVGGGAASFALTGIGSTLTTGVVVNNVSAPLVGSVATLAQGAMLKGNALILTGSSSILSQGTVNNSTPAIPSFSFNPWRELNADPAYSPFTGSGKHVALAYHPTYARVYTFGGDFGTGANAFSYDGGAGTDTQPYGGMTFTTNKPSGASTYTEGQGAGAGTTSYRNDMYSINPYGTTPPWRLEHPYLPQNFSGSPEDRPPCNCQRALVWDSSRNKFWAITTHERGASDGSMYGLDPWAIGAVYSPADEPTGTYSWVPSPIGGAGTFAKETTNALVYKSSGYPTPTYIGGRLYTSDGDERIANWTYSSDHDVIVTMSCYTNSIRLFIFKPSTKTYEWRTVPKTGYGSIYMQSSPIAVLKTGADVWVYAVAYGTRGGVRGSYMFRANLTAALALSNGGTLADNTSNWQAWDLPWSLCPDSSWEISGDTSAWGKVTEHAGLADIEGKILIAVSYEGIVQAGVTKMAAFIPSLSGQANPFYATDACPDTSFLADAWVKLPDTSEMMMGMISAGNLETRPGYPANKWLAYRPTHLGPLSVDTFDSSTGQLDACTQIVIWQSSYVTTNGTIVSWGVGNHDQTGSSADNGVREYNPTTNTSSYVYANNHGTQDQYSYDNHPYWYIDRINSLVIPSAGQYDRNTNQWASGSLQPGGNKVIGTASDRLIYADPSVYVPYVQGGIFNSHLAWSKDYDCGIMFGGAQASTGDAPFFHFVVPSVSGINTTAVSQGNDYTIYAVDVTGITKGSPAVPVYKRQGRDGACFVNDYVYWVGGLEQSSGAETNHFFRMKITPHLTTKATASTLNSGAGAIVRLSNAPASFMAGLLRFDKYLNALLLVTDKGIFAYDLTYAGSDGVGTWIDLTSQTGWMSEWSSAPLGKTPNYCMGDFVDSHVSGGVTTKHRRFYFRAGANDPTIDWDTTSHPGPVARRWHSLKLKRA